jgi:hypothetical protein
MMDYKNVRGRMSVQDGRGLYVRNLQTLLEVRDRNIYLCREQGLHLDRLLGYL